MPPPIRRMTWTSVFLVGIISAFGLGVVRPAIVGQREFERLAAPIRALGGRVYSGGDGMGVFRGAEGLFRINFDGTALTDAQLAQVAPSLEFVEILTLGGTSITDQGL